MQLLQTQTLTLFARRKIHILLPLTAVYILGIACHSFSTDYRLCLGIISLITIVLLTVNQLSLRACIRATAFLSMFAFGGFLYHHQHTTYDNFFLLAQNKSWNIQGKILNKETTTANFPYCTTVRITAMKERATYGPWQSYDAVVVIHSLLEPYCAIDDTVELFNLTFKNPSNKEYVRYLIKEGFNATVFLPKVAWRLIARPTYSAGRSMHQTKSSLLKNIQQKMSPQTFALFSSLFFG